MFDLAQQIRPRTFESFHDVEALRGDLVRVLQEARWQEQQGVITDLSSRHTGPENRFLRIGRGSIGGKGRGVAFISTQIVRHGLLQRFTDLQIRIPKTVVLGTDAFDAFMEQMDVDELLSAPDEETTRRMLAGAFSDHLLRDLRQAFDALKGPLAVRSSSLFEDSRFQPFAGVYATYMLPNNHPDRDAAFEQLVQAIKSVYASTFWIQAQRYMAGTPDDADDQKMAVLVQQVVGQTFGSRFYPHLSGVAQSYNYYPIGSQRAEEGVAHIALGLGHTVVGGGVALRFSPASPQVLPQFPSAESYLWQTQREFYALDLSRPEVDLLSGPEASLCTCDLAAAAEDGTLALSGSVYCPEDDVVRDNLAANGPRVVTFNNILKWNAVPLAEALSQILPIFRRAMGQEVEIEFALDMAGWGREVERGEKRRSPRLYLLQLRPMTSPDERSLQLDLERLPPDTVLCRTDRALGHGSIEDIRDIVYVTSARLTAASSRVLVPPLRERCRRLRAAGRPFMLVGPGRWGSADPLLGIGVTWSDIAGVHAIIELPLADRHVEPSQGTHFFRNITAAKVVYLTVAQQGESTLDLDWLEQMSGGAGGEVRHIELAEPIGVHVDGRKARAAIVKRAATLHPE